MAAQNAIVGDVRIHHQKIMIADTRVRAAAQGATMNIDILAKLVVRADCQIGLLAMELQILGLNADHTKWKKPIGRSDDSRPLNNDMGIQPAVLTNRNKIAYTAIRANLDSGANHGSG
jgi:hypothetical protein